LCLEKEGGANDHASLKNQKRKGRLPGEVSKEKREKKGRWGAPLVGNSKADCPDAKRIWSSRCEKKFRVLAVPRGNQGEVSSNSWGHSGIGMIAQQWDTKVRMGGRGGVLKKGNLYSEKKGDSRWYGCSSRKNENHRWVRPSNRKK